MTENAKAQSKNRIQHIAEKIISGVLKERRTRQIAYTMIIRFAVLIILNIAVTAAFITIRYNSAMKAESVELISELGTQMSVNVDNAIATIEANANMVFADEMVYVYDPVKNVYSDYDYKRIQKRIAENLYMQSALRSYTDYAIIYSNGESLGILSDKTKELYGDNLYIEMINILGKEKSAWATGYSSDFSLAYYVVRVNDNSILIVSSDLGEVIDPIKRAANATDLTVYLTKDNKVVLYSTDPNEKPGGRLAGGLGKRVSIDGGTVLDNRYFVNTAVTSNGWLVIMEMPASELAAATVNAVTYAILIGIVFSILAIIVTIRMSARIIGSVNQTVHNLDVKAQIDLLTGILNKKSFEEIVDNEMSNGLQEYYYAMVFMDVDNFKNVNDRCGHDIGDEVLKFFARSMQRAFRDADIKGRLGGDEFCVLMRISRNAECDVRLQAEAACRRFYDILHSIGKIGRHEIPAITSSMGIAIAGENDKSFSDLYRKADTALYESKRNGKDQWTVYHTGMTEKTE